MGARASDAAARSERARMIGLFRYRLIREAADPGLSTRARGRVVRAVAAAEHLDPTGRQVRVSRDTLDRWIRAWRRGGFDAAALAPARYFLRPNFFSSFARVFGSLALRFALSSSFWPLGDFANLVILVPNLPMPVLPQVRQLPAGRRPTGHNRDQRAQTRRQP
jgi:helix-turn-helix protein